MMMAATVKTTTSPLASFYSNAYLFSSLSDQAYPDGAATLICRYVGSDTTGNGCEFLQRRYLEQNSSKPAKIKPLRVLSVDFSGKAAIATVLERWREDCGSRVKKTIGDQERAIYTACFDLALHASVRMRKLEIRVTKAIDESGTTQAICLAMIDPKKGIGIIEYLFSSPENARGILNSKPAVEGAGTALVEHAIAQVVQESGRADVEINLFALQASKPFFEKLHFSCLPEDPDSLSMPDFTHVLSGKQILYFMRDFAGRAIY